MTMSSAADIKRLNAVLAKVLDGMKPPEDVTVTEWAEKHRKLSSESSAEVGTWRTSRTPYLREPMNAFLRPENPPSCDGGRLAGWQIRVDEQLHGLHH
ncbi:MAG: hypothetical protein ACLTSY_09450 [Subdoligranulum sp.]